MKHYLSIDYGLKHTGLAVASTSIAEPLQTVPTDKALEFIDQIIKDHHIDIIVIGLSENQMAQNIKQFGQKLQNHTHLPIIYHDETLSSLETRKKLAQARLKKSKREHKIDHLVATAILQDYLDSN